MPGAPEDDVGRGDSADGILRRGLEHLYQQVVGRAGERVLLAVVAEVDVVVLPVLVERR
jgi:hypothetical protein